jgi:hypothetical protein
MKARQSLPAMTAAFLLAASPGMAEEQFIIDTAGDLARLCATKPAANTYVAAVHMCQGYIIGAHHFHEAMETGLGGQGEGIYCVPAEGAPSRDEIMADFSAWVNSTPGMPGQEAIEALMQYAATRFPCE